MEYSGAFDLRVDSSYYFVILSLLRWTLDTGQSKYDHDLKIEEWWPSSLSLCTSQSNNKSQNLSSIFCNVEYFRIWNVLEYGIFWNMEYSSKLPLENFSKLIRHSLFDMNKKIDLITIFMLFDLFQMILIYIFSWSTIIFAIWTNPFSEYEMSDTWICLK